jgi:hypothetical protein
MQQGTYKVFNCLIASPVAIRRYTV